MESRESSSSRSENLFLIGMVASMTCWGLSWASGKVLASYGSALSISFSRFSITFFSLLLVLLVLRQPLTILRSGLRDLFFASIFIALYSYLFFKGLSIGKAGAGGVLVTVLNPIIAYFIMLVLSQRKPTHKEIAGILIGFAAGFILLKIWDNPERLFAAGNIYLLLASFTWAILSLFTSRSAKYGSPVTFSLWMYAICSLLILPLTDIYSDISLFANGDSKFWWNLFFSGTITTAVATTYFFYATSKIGAGKASTFIFFVPFSAALGSWLFLGEIPEWHTVVGGLLGIIAVLILNRR